MSRLAAARSLLVLAADARPSGVRLTTETSENAKLHEHCGYEVVGEARAAGTFETWGLFRGRQ